MRDIKKKLTALGLSSAIVLSGAYLVAPFEGKENKAYLDPVDIWTICYGSTKDVKKGDRKTDDECLELLAEDLAEHDKKMLKYIKVPVTDTQHAAFLSFTYNVGVGAFSRSTLLKKLNKGDYIGACNELLKWDKADGRVLKGLTKRRHAERDMCLNGVKQ